MKQAIQITALTKFFRTSFLRKKTALSEISLSIDEGEVVGILGPNGSGKSTLFKLLLGFLSPTSGQILIHSKHAGSTEAKKHIGYLPENPRFQKFLTGQSALAYFGGLYGLKGQELASRIRSSLELVGLDSVKEDPVSSYSKGMVQRLAIAQATLNAPRILILDEPMSGLDPEARNNLKSLIRNIHSTFPKTTVLFSSHVLDDVEQLCTKMVRLAQGKLEAQQ